MFVGDAPNGTSLIIRQPFDDRPQSREGGYSAIVDEDLPNRSGRVPELNAAGSGLKGHFTKVIA
jgi:hypothetical protein